jgi:hypothetical protein
MTSDWARDRGGGGSGGTDLMYSELSMLQSIREQERDDKLKSAIERRTSDVDMKKARRDNFGAPNVHNHGSFERHDGRVVFGR